MSDFSSLDTGGMVLWALVFIGAYLIGNLSPATLISKASGVDIRKEGSGNPGTTNMLRVMGKKAAVLTLIIDLLKGVAAVLLGKYAGGESLAVLCGLAVFLGHIFPVLYKFKGGKGIATALGVLLALSVTMALFCLALAVLGFVTARRVSVGSLLAALALPVLAYFYMPDYIIVFALMAALVVIKHRSNIRRLVKGEEPKISLKKKQG